MTSPLPISRRTALRGLGLVAATAITDPRLSAQDVTAIPPVDLARDLERIAAAPVLRSELLTAPVTVASIELLRSGKTFLLRQRPLHGRQCRQHPGEDRSSTAVSRRS